MKGHMLTQPSDWSTETPPLLLVKTCTKDGSSRVTGIRKKRSESILQKLLQQISPIQVMTWRE
uniref:Uncharacterized protein n=1 Tax=Utricularia reniformis TaxID=192314 RepID=A0A1Y0AZP5_9LAMI|nr:hypothetical protein AEK19_MT0342 [Utricularia reniformis]ART30614.1 hypothetical protein AEK19_MT0342 [Utricularia reniformis]